MSTTMTVQTATKAPAPYSWEALRLSATAETLEQAVLAEIIVRQEHALFLRTRFVEDDSRPASHRTYAEIDAAADELHASQLRHLLLRFAPATIAGVAV